eukprot:s516_g10.t1
MDHSDLQQWQAKPWGLYPQQSLVGHGSEVDSDWKHSFADCDKDALSANRFGSPIMHPCQVAERRGDPLSCAAVSISVSRGTVHQVSRYPGNAVAPSGWSDSESPQHASLGYPLADSVCSIHGKIFKAPVLISEIDCSVGGSDLAVPCPFSNGPHASAAFGSSSSICEVPPIGLSFSALDVISIGSAQSVEGSLPSESPAIGCVPAVPLLDASVQHPSSAASSSAEASLSRNSVPHTGVANSPTVPPLPEIPTFARQILETPVHGMPAGELPPLRGFWVRIWYIHLQMHARSFLVRHRQLAGPPHTWQQQVEALWVDVLLPQEDRSVVLVTPTPPRNHFESELTHDLILFQGDGGRFLPGVVTMRPLDPGISRSIYSGAVALPPVINSHAIIESLSLTRSCQDRLCTVRQGRTVLVDAQYYQMHHGLSYIVDVGHERSRAAGSGTVSASARAPHGSSRPVANRPDHAVRLELLTQLRAQGLLSGSVANVDEVDSADFPAIASDDHGDASVDLVSLSCPGKTPVSSQCVLPLVCSVCHDPTVPALDVDVVSSLVPPESARGVLADEWITWVLSAFTLPPPTASELECLFADACGTQCKVAEDAGPGERPPTESEHALRQVPVQAQPNRPPVVPQFARAMLQDLPEEFLTGVMTLRGFMVRTWYIHHRNVLTNRVPRFLQITGPPHTWAAQVTALWFDRLVPLERLSIHVVQPQPYRSRHDRIIAFDLIVSQGLYIDRRSGLVTVHPPVDDPNVPSVALATSFATRVAGQDIVGSADFHSICQRYRCLIFFRWQEIPDTDDPVHDMHAGDGFALHVHGPPRPLQQSSSASAAAPDQAEDQDVHMAPAEQPGQPSSTADATQNPGGSPAATAPLATNSLKRVLLYRLGFPVTPAVVRWTEFLSLCADVAQALNALPIDVVTVHQLQSRPVGQPPTEEGVIVQMRNDLEFASDEQLVLLDVVLHRHSTGRLSVDSPFADRRVVKIQRPVTRTHLLEHARVDNYCEFVDGRCLVKLNHALWPAQDHAPRHLLHGAYIQVLLPPPASTDLPVLRTIQLVEDTANVMFDGDFASFYPHWFSAVNDDHDVQGTSASDVLSLTGPPTRPAQCKGTLFCDFHFDSSPLLEHINDEDQGSPPSFTRAVHTAIPAPAGVNLALPPILDFQSFVLEFGVTFRDRAVVEYEDQGPVLHVLTWYIHHGVVLRCTRPIVVQLEADPTTWPDALTAPWREQLQPGIPVAFREVRPNPPRLFRDQHMAHIILEQGIHLPNYAVLVSILSQGLYHDATTQIALSLATAISAEDVIRAVHLEDRCTVYRCTVWSGIMQFEPAVREEVFSGIGIYLHIHAARFRHLLLDYGSQPFWNLDSSSSAASSHQDVSSRRVPTTLPPGYARSVTVLQEASNHDAHWADAFVPDLRVAWQQYLACTPAGPYRFHVIVWFCDHVRLPRSSEGRLAELPLDPTSWTSALRAIWNDWVLPGIAVSYYVVRPTPLGAAGVVAHIILAQNEAPDHASVLISSTLPGESPWDPVHRVVRLPTIVDHHMLIHEGGLMNMCPPMRFGLRCQSWIDAQELTDGHLYLASSGDGFLIAASESPSEMIPITHPPDFHINRLFCKMKRLLTDVSCAVAAAVDLSLSLDFQHPGVGIPISLQACLDLPDVSVTSFAKPANSLPPSPCSPTLGSSMSSPQHVVAGNPDSKVVLSLDACLDLQPKISPSKSSAPEILCRQLEDWPQQIADTTVSLSALPIGLNLSASTLWAFQDPCAVMEPALANSSVFYVDGSAFQGFAAWSMVLVRYDECGCPSFRGCCADRVYTATNHPHFLGAQYPDNISAELTATIIAMLSSLCMEDLGQVVVRPDLKLSAMLAEDLWNCRAHHMLAALCQLVGGWFAKVFGKLVEVRGHTQHPWNDLADSLAKHVVYDPCPVGCVSLRACHDLIAAGDISWAWLVGELPSLKCCFPPETDIASWKIEPCWHKPVLPPSGSANVSSEPHAVQFTVGSANVLALGTEDVAVPAATCSERALRLDAQWHVKAVAVIGLQESRRDQGCVEMPHYFGFASGFQQTARATHFGCELWLHKTLPLDSAGTLTWKDFKATVVHADPRRLFVNLRHSTLAVSFVVLHAPCKTAHTSIQELSDWWDHTCRLAHRAHLASLTWVFVDANAPLASAATALFSTFGSEGSNPQGAIFESALQQLEWYVPSTMAQYHQGPTHTWTHPRGGQVRRDYVLVSHDALALTQRTWTDVHFDGGLAHEDHLPTMMRCAGFLAFGSVDRKIQWDSLALLDVERCAAFRAAVRSMPVPTWQTHVDAHALIMERQLLSLARQFFEKRNFAKTRPRLSEATHNLIALKRSCLDYGRANHLMSDATFKEELRSLEVEVRLRVKLDQRQFYDELVEQLDHSGQIHDSKQVFKLLSRLGGRKTKAQHVRALPMLHVDGESVTSFSEQQRVWLRQFADIEAGHVVAKDAFPAFIPAAFGIPEAPGPDDLPTDVLKAGAVDIAKHLTVLTTKIAAHGKEPECWRGGRLIPLHKGKSKRTDPLGYRAIFLNNFTTKTYHAVLRGHLVRAWDAVLEHMQYGGRKGFGCDLAHHLVQAHLAYCRQQKLPGAILFIDFRSAFYSVVRQGLFHQPMDDTAFLNAMYRLGVHPDHVQALLVQANQDAAIGQIPAHAITLLRDVLSATYFQMDGIQEIAVTTRGTRPGDPIGDVAFNLVMALILKDITQYMAATNAEWEGSPVPVADFHHFQHPSSCAWAEIAYVDDLAITLKAPTNDQVIHMTHQATNALMQASRCRGLEPTFGAGKTELLLSPKGIGTTQCKQCIAEAGQCVAVKSVQDDQIWKVPVVLTYKHLGTWVNNDGKATHAIRASLSTARKAWGPLVRPFLAKKHILPVQRCKFLNP